LFKLRKASVLLLIFILLSTIFLQGCTDILSTEVENNTNIKADKLEVHILDVGQADSILIQLPNNETILIDGGNRSDSQLITEYLEKLNIKTINYLIATHPHEDHIGGLPVIIKNFEIGKIYMPKVAANTKIYETLLEEIKGKGLKVTAGKGGENIISTEDLKFNIIGPNSDKYDETNEYSIVTRLAFRETSFLFTGDAEKKSEEEIIERGYSISSNLLKIGHHGGRTSTSIDFLKMVKPKYAVISVEDGNDYGHPHKEVLDRLDEEGITVLRTDKLGTIRIISDGKDITFDEGISGEIEHNNQSEDNNEIEEKYFIGNKNTKVYHTPTCSSLPKPENQIIFYTKETAEKEGFRPDTRCVKE